MAEHTTSASAGARGPAVRQRKRKAQRRAGNWGQAKQEGHLSNNTPEVVLQLCSSWHVGMWCLWPCTHPRSRFPGAKARVPRVRANLSYLLEGIRLCDNGGPAGGGAI
jgi:hypothetical protein